MVSSHRIVEVVCLGGFGASHHATNRSQHHFVEFSSIHDLFQVNWD